jgi:hypothetical protein
MSKHKHQNNQSHFTSTTRVMCYHPPTYIFAVDGCEIWAGRNPNIPDVIPSRKIDEDAGFDLVLNCTNSSWKHKELKHEFPSKLTKLFSMPFRRVWEPVDQINFDMRDGSAPWEFALEFWQELIRKYKGKRILVYCIGGHGRTGTVLGAFLAAAGCEKVIDMVRKYHCEDAIETKTQEQYLDYMEEEWSKADQLLKVVRKK